MVGIPPPPPLPPGTVVPPKRLKPPSLPAGSASFMGRGLGSSSNSGTTMPTAIGNGVQQTPAYGVSGIPVPPPLPPDTVIPKNRPLPPPLPAVAGLQPAQSAVATLPQPPGKVVERPANGKDVQFPAKVKYFESAEDIRGDKERGILRLRNGQMVAVYKTDDLTWWLGKAGDDVGWIASATLQEMDPRAPGRQRHVPAEDSNPRRWDSKKEGQMTAGEMDMDKTDFGMTQATTFDHHGSKITAFFIQVSGVRRGVKQQGDIWVVAKTLKAFNRLRVAWEEDYGNTTIPVEPPPARWADCSEADWSTVKGAALRNFLEEVKQWPNLKHSQDLKHFLTTDRVNLTGGMISKKTMKPYLDAWIKTSSEPSWTLTLPPIPSRDSGAIASGKPSLKVEKVPKAAIPGLRAGDESFGQLTSRRPKLRRSGVFEQISALAAVTRQEAQLEVGRRGWTHAGIKLQLLTQGGDACSLKRRSERNIYQKYYAEDEYDESHGGGASQAGTPRSNGSSGQGPEGQPIMSRALSQRGGFNQMKFHMRYSLEKIMYGRMENLSKENNTKYAVYAKKKEQEKLQKDGNVAGHNKRGMGSVAPPEQHKKTSMFQLETLAERLDKIAKVNESQPRHENTLDRCQYTSRLQGRFTMPVAAQLMALDELTRERMEHFIKQICGVSRPKLERMKEVDGFLEDKRVRCYQMEDLVQRMHTSDEKLLVVLTCCARLTDAVEAEEHRVFGELERCIDPLNLKRAKLTVEILVQEAQAEDASRGSRKAAREVHADVQRARKALGFLSKAVEKIRSGTIKADMFEELKERLEAAADAAHEEYCDAVKDAKPANEYAEKALAHKEAARNLYQELDALGTAVKERVKVHRKTEAGMMEPADTEESLLVSALEVLLTIASNAYELATRAADNARFDMQTALDEVAKAEKLIRRVELEERRARNECDAAEGHDPEGFQVRKPSEPSASMFVEMNNVSKKGRHKGAHLSGLSSSSRPKVLPGGEDLDMGNDCPFGEWEVDMRDHTADNLEEFRKECKYRLHLDKAIFRGTEDVTMMATLLAKVQLLRDLKELRADAKIEETRRQEGLLQSNSKRRKRSSVKREHALAAGIGGGLVSSRGGGSRESFLRQQSSAGGVSAAHRRALIRQQSSLGPDDGQDDGFVRKEKGKRKTVAFSSDMRGRDFDPDDDGYDDASSDDGASILGFLGPPGGEDGSYYEDEEEESSEADSVFGSDLDADDDDLGVLRKKAGRRTSNARMLTRGSIPKVRIGDAGVEPNGSRGGRASVANRGEGGAAGDGSTRRHDQMRRELIQQSLGKRRSIGTRRLTRSMVPPTPRRAGVSEAGGRAYSGHLEAARHAGFDDGDYR